jgi:hypothetical protein
MWVFDGDHLVSAGELLLVTDSDAVARLHAPPVQLEAGRTVAVLPVRSLATLRDDLPAGVHLRGQVTRLTPGRQTAWLDIGSSAGLKKGDGILVRRNGIPIARGSISVLDGDVSLTTLTPLVGNAVAETGDTAELWPSPEDRRWGRLNSAVLAVGPAGEGTEITIFGSRADGLSEERLVDLFRRGRYIGVAVISEVFDPIVQARVMASASVESPAVGDVALVRPPAGREAGPLSAAVFHVEPGGDYCLVAAGEVDGIQEGEKLVVRRPDPEHPGRLREAVELTLDKVNITYSGALVRSLIANQPPLAPWEFAHRRTPGLPVWRSCGRVDRVLEASRTALAELSAEADVAPGRLVRLVPGSAPAAGEPAGGVVLHRAGSRLTLYIPPGWGEPERLAGAAVETADPAATSPPRADFGSR